MKQFLLLVICAVAISVNAQSGAKALPSVKIKTLEGKTVDITDYTKKGKAVVFSFWATWCAPCKKELDNIAEIYDEWQKNYDVEVIAITIDDARNLPKIKPLVMQKKWKYTVLSDVNSDLKRELNFPSVPQTFLVDKKGNIVYSHTGYAPGDEDELEKKIKKIASK
jgi:peroxiredoxin